MLRAVKDSVLGLFHSLFSLAPIERFLICLKFFLYYLEAAVNILEHLSLCTSLVLSLGSGF